MLVLICLIIGHTMRRDILRPDRKERRDRRVIRMVSMLLPVLAIAFIVMTAETILDSRSSVWPAFILTFQILFTAFRLFLYGIDSIRTIGSGNTLIHIISDVNLTVVLVALHTTIAALLGRFCTDDGMSLILTVLSASLILCAILRVAILAFRRAWASPGDQQNPRTEKAACKEAP